jgi:quercetin dioxygenase-like cupin family protein
MYFCDTENRQSKELLPGLHIQSFWGEKSTLMTVNLEPGTHVPPHSHPHEQCGTVLAGEITFTIAGEVRTLQPGACYIIPGHVEHSATAGKGPVKLVELFTPLREEYHYE